MPMPPYLRFPASDSFQQRFWGLKPRNPTCGKVSLENGAKFFAWGNIILDGFAAALFAVVVILLIMASSSHPSQKELLEKRPEDWVGKLHMKQSYGFLIIAFLIGLIVSVFMLRLNWKMKRAIAERDVPVLKNCFLIILCLDILFLLFFDIEGEIIWTKAIFIDAPLTIFEIFGLIFTYSFIASLINPDYNQNEDMNRIQFNP